MSCYFEPGNGEGSGETRVSHLGLCPQKFMVQVPGWKIVQIIIIETYFTSLCFVNIEDWFFHFLVFLQIEGLWPPCIEQVFFLRTKLLKLGSCGNSLELNCILTSYSSSSLFLITDPDLIRKILENISNSTFFLTSYSRMDLYLKIVID